MIAVSGLKKGSDIFSPGRVFGFVWAVAIGLTNLKLSRFQQAWDWYMWLTTLIPVASFLVATYIFQLIYMDEPCRSIPEMRRMLIGEPLNSGRLFWTTTHLFTLYLLAYFVQWIHLGTLPLYSRKPDVARTEFSMFAMSLFVNAMPLILFLIVQFVIFVKGHGFRKAFLSVMFLMTFGSSFFLLNRLFYVFFLVMAFCLFYYGKKGVRLRYVLITLPVFIVVMRILQSFREARFAKEYFYVVSEMKFSRQYAEWTMPYMYIVMNLENFARAVEHTTKLSFGYFTFDFLTALTGLKHSMASYFGLDAHQYLISGYNTYPFFWNFYLDFGVVGLLVLPFLLGVGISILYHKMRQNPNHFMVSLYSIALFEMTLSFFANMLSLLNVVFNVILMILVQLYIRLNDGSVRAKDYQVQEPN